MHLIGEVAALRGTDYGGLCPLWILLDRQGWPAANGVPRLPGARRDKEVGLGPSVAAGSEYHIVKERHGRGRVTTLELRGVCPFPGMTAQLQLPHRLKDVYRKSKNDQRVEDPHNGVISFAIATDAE